MGQTENGYLVRGSAEYAPARRWRAYLNREFPIADLESWTVVDSNGARQQRFQFPDGGTRTWHFRPLEPIGAKLRDLRPFFDHLERSIEEEGIKVPVLIWDSPEDRFYVRYGASRVHVAKRLGWATVPAIVCSYSADPFPINPHVRLESTADVFHAFGPLASVGWLEVSHERIDAHHLEPL